MSRFVQMRIVPSDLATTRALVLDWNHDPEWRTAVISMTSDPLGPAAPGQRLLETMRFVGATFTTPTHIVDADDTSAQFEGGSAMVRVRGRRLLERGADEVLERVLAAGRLHLSAEPECVEDAEHVIIVVGTAVDEHLNPNPGHVLRAMELMIDHLRDGQHLVLRSTVYPGTTAMIERLLELRSKAKD